MKRPQPWVIVAVLAPLTILGLILWQDRGIDIWLQQAMMWCY